MSHKIIQSYVWHGDKCFFVSTINRESSAAAAYGATYAETMAWEYDHDTAERKAFVGQDEGATNSISAHIKACKRLHETGQFDEEPQQ